MPPTLPTAVPPLSALDSAIPRASLARPLDSDEPEDRVFVRILQFLLEAHSPESVAKRAATSIGLLPEVAWAEIGGGDDEMRGEIEVDFGPDDGCLRIHLLGLADARSRARVKVLADLVATIHRREREIRRLRDEAHTDPLTGLFNRRGFEPFVEQALARSSRTGEAIALLLCDVDYFKRINDTHGHEAGDRALQAVADSMVRVLRPSDLAARIGGDELAILLAGSDAMGATRVAQRLREAVMRANPLTAWTLSLSVGIADHRVLGNIEALGLQARAMLFSAADEALYAAKAAGRDRYACHGGCFAPTEVLEGEPTEPLDLAAC
jgi:diguanylate cyclase (GGDEF)-like protein